MPVPQSVGNSRLGGSALLLRPISGDNSHEETVERLLQTIRLGLVGPEEKFPSETDLANMLEVTWESDAGLGDTLT